MSPSSSQQQAEDRGQMTGAADSRTGGRKDRKTSRQQWRCERGTALQIGGPGFAGDPHKIAPARMLFIERESGAPLAEPFSRCDFWEAQSSAHARRVPWNSSHLSLVKAQRETLRAASAWLGEDRDSDGEHERYRGAADGHPARSVCGSGELRREIRQPLAAAGKTLALLA